MDAAQHAQSYALQAQAVATLARIQAPSARQILQSALITPSHRDVVRRAALSNLSFAGFSTQDQVRIAGEHAEARFPTEVRLGAIETLGYLASLQNRRSMSLLTSLIDDDDPYIRKAVLETLGRIGAADELVTLQNHLDQETSTHLIRTTRSAIRQIEERQQKTSSSD
jgi:HEAT repeat protein